MIKIYLADKESRYERLDDILKGLLHSLFEIKRTENGKPYIEGNPLFFSITHSGERALIAVCDRPVGVDLELFTNRKYEFVFASFTDREQLEITSENEFLYHWTAREAFIKMRGSTLASDLKRIEFYGGDVYLDGVKQPCKITRHNFDFGVAAVCVENVCKPTDKKV